MAKVFIVQNSYIRDETSMLLRPRFDLSAVYEYGEPVEILHGRISPLATAPAMIELRATLRNYTDSDYLLAIGAPAFLVAAGAVAASFNNGRVHVLHWDKGARKYFPITFDIHGGNKAKAKEA